MYEWVGVPSRKEVIFLHVLAVVPLLIAQPEHPLFEDRILLVP